MAGVRAAIRYAKAVLSLATDQKSADAVNNDMKQIATAIAESKDLNNMLQSPVIKSSAKKEVLSEGTRWHTMKMTQSKRPFNCKHFFQ